jgi:SAM-dependent methyltransferase
MSPPAEKLREFYRRQDAWFAAERSRLLRRVRIADRHSVLDLGTGTGQTLPELRRRVGGPVVALDRDLSVLRLAEGARVLGRAERLPFADGAFDLAFAQMFFLWARPLDAVLAEVRRVLSPGGQLVAAAEPDYGGAVEHPGGCGGIEKLAAELAAEGADVRVGRKLGAALAAAGFESVECGSHPARPLESAGPGQFLFVPYFSFLAARS